ncbi:MAG: TrbI/VirB10 family protein, partial [Janthinobacterium lividum]
MSGAQPPAEDNPGNSPALLAPLPRRGAGVRRLNRLPIWGAGLAVCAVIGGVGYTYDQRSKSHAAAAHDADKRPEGATRPAVLNGAPDGGEIQSSAFRNVVKAPAGAPPSPSPTPAPGPAQAALNDGGGQVRQEDDPATQARRQAWQTYYQQLASLQQSRMQAAQDAMKADTSSGMSQGTAQTGAGAALGQQIAQAQGSAQQAQEAATAAQQGGQGAAGGVAPVSTAGGYGVAAGGLGGGGLGVGGFGGGYPILPPAGPDATGAREKQGFVSQAGNLGQNDTLAASVRDPVSPYMVTAGDVITCVAQGGENSDTPGQFVGRVSRNIYDSATGRFLLIPQGSKVIGTYDNIVSNGQSRIPTVLTRLIFPDSSSIPLGAMPGADQAGYAGLHDQVDRHMWEKFGNALILALGSAGIQLSQGTGQSSNGYNAQQIGAAAIGQQFGELGQEYA